MLLVSVLVQDRSGATAEADDAARLADRREIECDVLADPEGEWRTTRGGLGRLLAAQLHHA